LKTLTGKVVVRRPEREVTTMTEKKKDKGKKKKEQAHEDY
jgi:hypothetical protein